MMLLHHSLEQVMLCSDAVKYRALTKQGKLTSAFSTGPSYHRLIVSRFSFSLAAAFLSDPFGSIIAVTPYLIQHLEVVV